MKKEELFLYFILFFLSIGGVIIYASSFYSLNKAHIGFAFALPPLVYLALKRYIGRHEDTVPKVSLRSSKRLFMLFIIFFLFFVSLSLLYWHSEVYHRPIPFFILVAMAYSVIAAQIFLNGAKKFVPIILLEIFIIAIIIRGSIYFLFPSIYGNDPLFHTNFVRNTISLGSIPNMGDYRYFPYTHLLTAYVRELSGLSIKNAYFVIAVIEVLASLFVFLIGKKLGGIRLGLLSAMVITLAPYNIFWGFWIIPMTLGMVFFIIILYLVLIRNTNPSIKMSILLVFFCLSIIFVHTVASFVSWLILTLILIGIIIYKFLFPQIRPRKLAVLSFHNFLFSPLQYRKFQLSFNLVSLFGVSLFSYWMFIHHETGEDIFFLFTRSLIVSLTKMDTESVTMVTLAPTFNYLSIFLIDLPTTLLLFFGVLGSLYLINLDLDRVKFTFISSAIILVFLVYGGGLLGTTAILPGRWLVFIEVILILLSAYGIYLLVSTQKTVKKQLVVCSIIIFIFAFSAITTPLTNSESPFYAKELGMRSGLFESEITAANYLDSHYNGTFARSSKYQFLKGVTLNPNETETYEGKMMAIRDYDLEKGFNVPLYGAKGKLLELVFPNSTFYAYLDSPKCNKVYDNGEVESYISK